MDIQNTSIDKLLQTRQNGMYDYSNSTKQLIDLGVKIGKQSTGEIMIPESFNKYLKEFNLSNLEFEWIVEYKDGKSLKQFDDGAIHNFSHIDLENVKSVSYISNFVWPTDNEEKRVIVKLDMNTGLFSFLNGYASQEVKAECCINEINSDKKLILFTRKRIGSTHGSANNEIKEFVDMLDEFTFYNRFVLGYETQDKKKIAVIIEPNGNIKLFDK